jgi:hypothetical protein
VCCNQDQTHFIIFTRLANRSLVLIVVPRQILKQATLFFLPTHLPQLEQMSITKISCWVWEFEFFYKQLNILIRIFKLILIMKILFICIWSTYTLTTWKFYKGLNLWLQIDYPFPLYSNHIIRYEIDVLMIVFSMLFGPNVLEK